MVARKGGLADNLGKLMLGLSHRGSREHVGLCYVIPVRQNYKHSPTATNGHLIYLFIYLFIILFSCSSFFLFFFWRGGGGRSGLGTSKFMWKVQRFQYRFLQLHVVSICYDITLYVVSMYCIKRISGGKGVLMICFGI